MNCRVCNGTDFGDVIDLGMMPLVNNLLRDPSQACELWPLKAVFCRECSLVQLTEAPPPQCMFDEYVYFTSHSRTMVNHARQLVNRHVHPGQHVLEVGSNDGYLLQHARDRGATILGIDPARNVSQHANSRGIPTLCEYFNPAAAQRIANEWGHADIIFANNVLAHVPDPHLFAEALDIVLAPEGEIHIEVPYLPRLIHACAFDTIYHEHQCYFTLTSLQRLFDQHGLGILTACIIDVHGGSLHVTVARGSPDAHVKDMIANEADEGVRGDRYYKHFRDDVEIRRTGLDELLNTYDSVAGYGAAAKAVVMLNAFQMGTDRIPWVADVSPHKQGKYIPGTCQPIVAPDQLQLRRPEAVLLFAWNIKDEILQHNREYLESGGTIIVPIPELAVIRSTCEVLQ